MCVTPKLCNALKEKHHEYTLKVNKYENFLHNNSKR